MPKFSGEYAESLMLNAPMELVKKHFCNPETIAKYHGDIERWEKTADNTIHYKLIPKSEKGVTFNGDYTVKYELAGDVFNWQSIGSGNIWVKGTIYFSENGLERTKLQFQQHMECEMQVNRLLAAVIKGIVSREISNGVKGYLRRMQDALPRNQ